MNIQADLVERVAKEYLESPDFNGYRFGGGDDPKLSGVELRAFLTELIRNDQICVRLSKFHLNPMIRRRPDFPADHQIAMLHDSPLDESEFIVLYPTAGVLRKAVDPEKFKDRPFSLMLARGGAQLEYRTFDLLVLETYRNDPRYFYEVDDMFGVISVSDAFYKSAKIKESDRAVLQTFGFAYNDQEERAVAVYLRYLHDLTPEHQQIWHARMTDGGYRVHPDYHRATVVGEWALSFPILKAFCMELQHINAMCALMKRPPLFRNDLGASGKPRGFSLLIRPTAEEYYKFVLLLDKAMSDNINGDFFQDEVPRDEEITRKDGRIEVRQIGTIRRLEAWLKKKFRTPDPAPLDEMLETFRKVRQLRQNPAHNISEDVFDQKYFKMQRHLVIEAYKAVQMIRMIFANHPACAQYEIEDVLSEGRISTF